MTLRVSGKNLDLGEALRGQVEERISDAMTKYFGGGFSGHVTVTREGAGFKTECSLHLDSGIVLQSVGAGDAYASFDQAAGRIETRLKRYKNRLRDNHHTDADAGDPSSYVVFETPEEEIDEEAGWSPVIVAESTKALRRMTVGFAVMELDLTGAPVVVFRHASHGRVNVVYRRSDGNVGWIDPAPANGATEH